MLLMSIVIESNVCIKNPETRSFLADFYHKETSEKLPTLIFIHGYKGFKDWGTFDLMARSFALNNILFVKFNFSHNGTTVSNPDAFDDLEAFGNNTYTKELSDLNALIHQVEKHPNCDTENIFLIGHSRGGGNTLIQSFKDHRIKGLITMAGVDSFSNRFPKGELLKKFQEDGVFYVENKRTNQKMPHYYSFYQDFKDHEKELNIQYAAQHLKKPFLIIHGSKDEAVSLKAANHLHLWAKNSQLKIIENASHTFGGKHPWLSDDLPEHLHEVVELSLDFLNRHL